MEKISCNVILDLLPLYCDGVCSQESCTLVRNHLKDCPDCSETLRQMKTEYRISNSEEQDHEAIVKDMAAAWQKTIKKTFLRGILITLCACALLSGTYLALTRLFLVPVPADKLEISVGKVTEQSVEISIKSTDHKKVSRSFSYIAEDGKYYLTMKRGILATENGAGENWECLETISRTGTTKSGNKVPVTEIYYGTGRESVLIWKADGANDSP